MRLRLLFESEVPTSINNIDQQQFVLEDLKKSMGNNGKWTSLLYDYADHKFGIPVNSPIEHNAILSHALTNLFKSTNVTVYVFLSKTPRIISIPGASKTISPELIRIEAARDAAFRYNNLKTGNITASMYEATANAIQNANKEGGEAKLLYDPTTNKLDTNISDVTVYISNTYINCMQQEDEVIASILYEIGKNTLAFKKYIQYGVLSIGAFALVYILTFLSYGYFGYKASQNEDLTLSSALVPYFSILSLIAIVGVISIYLSKRRHLEYDEFVIKCGYGEALNRAIDNYNKYIFADQESAQTQARSSFNFLDRICHWAAKIGKRIYNFFSSFGITSHQSIEDRRQTIADKTQRYDTSSSNLDRTAPIDL